MMRCSVALAALAACLAGADAWAFTGPSPLLRAGAGRAVATRDSATTIFMGRKPATVGKNAPGREKKDRVKTSKGVGAVIKVKAVTGVTVSKAMILQKLEKVTKDSFASELLSDKIKTFMVEEAGSSMYPKLMNQIKSTAQRLGVAVPDRWAYEARANAYQRTKLQAKITAREEEAAAAKAAAAEAAAAPAAE